MDSAVTREGRTTVIEGTTDRFDPHGTAGSMPQIDDENGALDSFSEYRGERELAAAVFRQAFQDLGVRMPGQRGTTPPPADAADRRSAELFLFDSGWVQMRVHWLSLLGLNDDEFQTVIRKPVHQGQVNRVLGALKALQVGGGQ